MICPGAAMAADSAVATEAGQVVSCDGDVLMTISPQCHLRPRSMDRLVTRTRDRRGNPCRHPGAKNLSLPSQSFLVSLGLVGLGLISLGLISLGLISFG